MLRHTFPSSLQNFVNKNSEKRKEDFQLIRKSPIVYPLW